MEKDLRELVAKLTLEEKASLCSGLDFWHTKGVGRLGVPSIMMTDGPHGVRKQRGSGTQVGLANSEPATCFPTAAATACSWDRELLREIGQALAEECLALDVSVLLGPGANIKRSPLCGRNFEYFSEDPYLSGEMAAAWIEGLQERGVGASLKHFAVNNQENRRMSIDAAVDERALREIYLAGFEAAVRKARPWTVMCAYNRVNGAFCSENEKLLTNILRQEWGFDGVVVTDWGACTDRVAGLFAGQDLEMPGSGGINDRRIVRAAREGKLSELVLDRAVGRLLGLVQKCEESNKQRAPCDMEAHHALARRAAAQSAVLLKNEGVLPLKPGAAVAVIGVFAKKPRYQGSGSSLINPWRMENAWDEILKYAPGSVYAAGYSLESDQPDEALLREAEAAVGATETAVVFAGLPEEYESEGFDREHIDMPESHAALIQRVAAVNTNTVVVLMKGAPVAMPWIDGAKAVLDGYLGGQAGGGGIADVLFGAVNPSGKLAETLPLKLEDALASRYFPMGPLTVEYRESLFVGYRWFDSARLPVLFPFGHGLSYTKFEYSDLEVSKKDPSGEGVTVGLTVRNAGNVAGAEVVQLYVRDVQSTLFRPEKELKGFEKVWLEQGESKRVAIVLDRRAFAAYNPVLGRWQVEGGEFELLAGASSADIRLRETILVESDESVAHLPDLWAAEPEYSEPAALTRGVSDAAFAALMGGRLPESTRRAHERFTLNSTLDDVQPTRTGRLLRRMLTAMMVGMMGGDSKLVRKMTERFVGEMPLRNIVTMSGGKFPPGLMRMLLGMMNVGRK